MPHQIVKFSYDIFLNYRTQQNNFNYQIILDFNCEILYFFVYHYYKNNLQLHDQHLMTYQFYLTSLQRNQDIDDRILMQMGGCVVINKPYLNKMIDGLIFKCLMCSYLPLHGLIIIVSCFVYLCLRLMESMGHIQIQGLKLMHLNCSENLVVRSEFVISRSLIQIYSY